MKEHPVIMSAPMVVALLDGKKTQTRRLIRPQPMDGKYFNLANGEWGLYLDRPNAGPYQHIGRCPYGQPGDRLRVKETWGINSSSGRLIDPCITYRAGGQLPLIGNSDSDTWSIAGSNHEVDDDGLMQVGEGWRNAMYMPRWASRITLVVNEVRIQRLNNISDEDCRAEGCAGGHDSIPNYRFSATPREHYRHVWETIHGRGSWQKNPWVWAITFERITNR